MSRCEAFRIVLATTGFLDFDVIIRVSPRLENLMLEFDLIEKDDVGDTL